METPTGKIERNRRHLHVVPARESGPEVERDTPLPTKVMTRSQTIIAARQQPTDRVMTRSQMAQLRDQNTP